VNASNDATKARRRILGCVRNRGALDGDAGALVLWSEPDCGEWKASTEELIEDLMLLGVPHYTTITLTPCQPPWRSASTKVLPSRWEKLHITAGDLPLLLRELPSLRKVIDPATMAAVDRPVAMMRRRDGQLYYAVDGEMLGTVTGSPAGLGDFPEGPS
jgi:hypothetical protein